MDQTLTPDLAIPDSLPAKKAISAEQFRDRWVLAAAALALLIKLLIAWNTFGTNDVLTFYVFAKSLSVYGLEWTYQSTILFNHPPLTADFLRGIFYLHHLPLFQTVGITFPFLLRLPGIMADFVVVGLLLQLNRSQADRIPTWAMITFALSPLSIMVSGYHGNTDAVMVMFLVAAAYFCVRDQPVFCGLFLALSTQVKIAPLLLTPIFFFYWMHRRKSISFTLPFALASLVLWSEPVLKFPQVFFGNVLSYSSFWGIWGISYLLRLTGRPEFNRVSFFDLGAVQNLVITICKIVIIAGVLLLAWRRRKLESRGLWESVAYAWILFFIFAPGVCIQYLIWLAPFILCLSRKFYAALLVGSSLFAFAFYNTISGGLPWFRGISTNALNKIWTPWSLLPWLILIAGLIVLWRKAVSENRGFRILSLQSFAEQSR